jgi:8-oxo-dGTP pyrophosphatase MutT (NUDIX family)
METTRHFVATVYVVNDGATLLHEHERLGMWLPPGGHIDRDELPHQAAAREVREETGLEVDLYTSKGDLDTGSVRSIPEPQHLLLEDINVYDETVGHQHIDFVFYGTAPSRSLDPAPNEAPVDDYDELRYWNDRRLLETYRRLSHDLRRRGCDERTVHRMGRVEEELRARDLDPDVIAREVDDAHR